MNFVELFSVVYYMYRKGVTIMDYSSIEKNIISLYAKIKNKKLPLKDLPIHAGMIKF